MVWNRFLRLLTALVGTFTFDWQLYWGLQGVPLLAVLYKQYIQTPVQTDKYNNTTVQMNETNSVWIPISTQVPIIPLYCPQGMK